MLAVVGHAACTADRLAAVEALDPEWVPALCLRGFAQLFKGRRALRPEALAWADRARAALEAGRGEAGDAYLVDALAAWAADQAWAAEQFLATRLLERPHDLFTVKLQHGLLFMMGQSQVMRERIEAHYAGWPIDDPDRGYVLGATVFARVECGDHGAALAARDAWAEGPVDDAWGLHAVAHLFHELGRYGDALDWLDARTTRWADCDRFGNHLDWHRALLHLELGGPARALELYDKHLRGVFDGNYRDMSNAVSILWRLEARGIDTGARWQELAEASADFLDDHGSAFADAHYILAQLHGGSDAAVTRLLDSMSQTPCEGYQSTVVREVGRPLCEALTQWQRDPQTALGTLRRLAGDVVRVGGSHAQRSLFEDVERHLSSPRGLHEG